MKYITRIVLLMFTLSLTTSVIAQNTRQTSAPAAAPSTRESAPSAQRANNVDTGASQRRVTKYEVHRQPAEKSATNLHAAPRKEERQAQKETVTTAPKPFNEGPENHSHTQEVTALPATVNAAEKKNELYTTFWTNYHVRNGKKASRGQRHCGCGGDLTFVNETTDTLDFYLSYMTPLETPTLEDAVLPSIRQKVMYPSFYVLPGDSTTLRGSCMGGLQYEVITRNSLWVRDNYKTPRYTRNSYVRMSCIAKRVVLN